MNAVLTGICRKGPKDGKVHTTMAGRKSVINGHEDEGFYIYTPAHGPIPAEWRWVPAASKEKPDA